MTGQHCCSGKHWHPLKCIVPGGSGFLMVSGHRPLGGKGGEIFSRNVFGFVPAFLFFFPFPRSAPTKRPRFFFRASSDPAPAFSSNSSHFPTHLSHLDFPIPGRFPLILLPSLDCTRIGAHRIKFVGRWRGSYSLQLSRQSARVEGDEVTTKIKLRTDHVDLIARKDATSKLRNKLSEARARIQNEYAQVAINSMPCSPVNSRAVSTKMTTTGRKSGAWTKTGICVRSRSMKNCTKEGKGKTSAYYE